MDWWDTHEVYQVSVLNFIYDKESEQGVSMYTMRTEDGRALSGRMSIVFVELPKYKDGNEKTENLTAAEKWCKFLLYADDSAKRSLIGEICKSDGGIMAASGILTKISQDDINWARQTRIDIQERDRLSEKNYMERVTQELAESHAALEKSHAVIEKKDVALAEKDVKLAEKDAQLLAQLREIELLRKKLEDALSGHSAD